MGKQEMVSILVMVASLKMSTRAKGPCCHLKSLWIPRVTESKENTSMFPSELRRSDSAFKAPNSLSAQVDAEMSLNTQLSASCFEVLGEATLLKC